MAVSWRQCHDALGLATVYGVAQASLERLSGSGKWGLPSNSQCPHILVFMLNLPLFTGGRDCPGCKKQSRAGVFFHLHKKGT